MNFKQIKENKVIKIIMNKYVLVFLIFVIWMTFFDENSYLNHRDLNEEVEELENANKYYESQIAIDNKVIENLNTPDSLEKYAREEYKMKRENEEIFLIEYDTIQNE